MTTSEELAKLEVELAQIRAMADDLDRKSRTGRLRNRAGYATEARSMKRSYNKLAERRNALKLSA